MPTIIYCAKITAKNSSVLQPSQVNSNWRTDKWEFWWQNKQLLSMSSWESNVNQATDSDWLKPTWRLNGFNIMLISAIINDKSTAISTFISASQWVLEINDQSMPTSMISCSIGKDYIRSHNIELYLPLGQNITTAAYNKYAVKNRQVTSTLECIQSIAKMHSIQINMVLSKFITHYTCISQASCATKHSANNIPVYKTEASLFINVKKLKLMDTRRIRQTINLYKFFYLGYKFCLVRKSQLLNSS